MNENECGKASKVIGMKIYVGISLFADFKRSRDQLTNQPTDMTSNRTHLKTGLRLACTWLTTQTQDQTRKSTMEKRKKELGQNEINSAGDD